ncbi:tetratricopeptide repeat protein [Luteolibacter pohnpeiensis]|uniref:Tetratricopeptide repeat protein n=1 Tax=Luteolibacter pohnpeiensis TaxID=454153 RepID=A0A934SBZ7_9BACT|nr:tetratricopeptide repeat protein [Luteolibacter pohnpeiensis]MBK1882498.1 tetratricopeptide repeat protein [Luteolibacter pohnpeiensis]
MQFHRSYALSSGALMATTAVAAAADPDLAVLATESLTAMQGGQWQEAHALLKRATDQFPKKEALSRFGPQFGVIYYRKGLCEIKMERWQDAVASFSTCYKDFPNRNGTDNPYEKLALLKCGEAEMGAGEWNLALQQFTKFSEERVANRDDYPRGAFFINQAVCHYHLGQIPEGNGNLEVALRNRQVFPTPSAGIITGVDLLVSAAIKGGNEPALLDFLRKNRTDLAGDLVRPVESQQIFIKLSADAAEANFVESAAILISLLPAADGSADESMRLARLSVSALIHEKSQDLKAACADYAEMVSEFPKVQNRESNLLNLIRLGAVAEQPLEERAKVCRQFLAEFPDSDQVPAVKQNLVAALFDQGDYTACIELVPPLIQSLPADGERMDFCTHVLGASYYYKGNYDLAEPILDEHVKKYPQSRYARPTRFLQAVTAAALREWQRAGGLLDSFVKAYPDFSANPLLPFALYERAVVHHAEREDQAALAALEKIGRDYPQSNVATVANELMQEIRTPETMPGDQ